MTSGQSQDDGANEAILRAMMADIGDNRVEELHLEDGEHTRNHAPITDTRRPMRLRRPQQVSDVWRIAQESGVFDDEDAAQVRGLNDLGGGRIYDQVRNQTLEILTKTHAPRSVHRPNPGTPHRHPSRDYSDPPSKRKKIHGGKAVPVSAPAALKPTQSYSQPRNRVANTNRATPSHFDTAALRPRPVTSPFNLDRNRLPNPEPEYLLKILVGMGNGYAAGLTMVHLYLSTAPFPDDMGLLRFYNAADGILMTERKLKDLVHHFPYATTELSLVFDVAAYKLTFKDRAEMERFDIALKALLTTEGTNRTNQQVMTTVNLRNGLVTSPSQNIARNIEASLNSRSQLNHSLQVTAVMVQSPELQLKSKISTSCPVSPMAASRGFSPTVKRDPEQPRASNSMRPTVRLPPVQSPFAHSSGDETRDSEARTVTESASSRSQSTVGPAPESNDRRPGYSQVTHRELEKIFEAAFQGVEGSGPRVRAAVQEAIELYYKINKNPEERRRIQYSRAELFSYRDHAVPPPPYLSELRFLPRPRWMEEENGRVSIESARVPTFTGVVDDMAWALDDSPRRAAQQPSSSQPETGTLEKERTTKKPNNDMKEAIKAGLMRSIWAPATSPYVMELAELDLGIDTATADLARPDGASSASSSPLATPPLRPPTTPMVLTSTPAQSAMSGCVSDNDRKAEAAKPIPSRQLRMIERVAIAGDALESVSEGISRLTINDHPIINIREQSLVQQPALGNARLERHFAINAEPLPVDTLSPARVPRTLTGVPSPTASTTGAVSPVSQISVSCQTAQAHPKGLAASRHARP